MSETLEATNISAVFPKGQERNIYMGSAIRSTADRFSGCGRKPERMPHAPSDSYITQGPETNSWTRKTSSHQ